MLLRVFQKRPASLCCCVASGGGGPHLVTPACIFHLAPWAESLLHCLSSPFFSPWAFLSSPLFLAKTLLWPEDLWDSPE